MNVVGCQYMFELGPFQAADDWMEKHLNVDPRTVMCRLRFFRRKHGSNFEIFEHEALDQTSWNRHELLKGWVLSGRNPAPYYLGLNLCRCSILIIARSAQPIASE